MKTIPEFTPMENVSKSEHEEVMVVKYGLETAKIMGKLGALTDRALNSVAKMVLQFPEEFDEKAQQNFRDEVMETIQLTFNGHGINHFDGLLRIAIINDSVGILTNTEEFPWFVVEALKAEYVRVVDTAATLQ